MTITFYNIPGISPANEPLFTSVANRTTALSSYIVKSWSTAYYPVQYENRIKCDTIILPLTTVFNYIKIEMYSQEWFYFIDSFTYVNEKVYFINLSLDAIQTFYFVTNIRRFEETRKLTFSGLRDNLSVDPTLYVYSKTDFDVYSNGISKLGVYVFQFKDMSGGNIILKDADTHTNRSQVEDILPTLYSGDKGTYIDGLKTFFFPQFSAGLNISYIAVDGTRKTFSINYLSYYKTFVNLINDENIVNAYYTKILPDFMSVNYSTYTLTDKAILYDNGMIMSSMSYNTWVNNQVTIKDDNYGSFITPIRAICDTNYVQVTIGEVNDNVIVPIELLEPETTYNLHCRMDYSSGTRTYWVDAQPLLDIEFRHICNSVESISVFNDMYNMYLAQNKGTLTTGVALQKTQAWVNFGNQILNQNAAKAFSGAMSGGTAGAIVAGVEATITSGVDMFNTMYGIDKSIEASRENAYYTPDTVKLGNNYSNDLSNNLLNRILIETRVADYEDIIEARAYTGYLAHDIKSFNSLSGLVTSYTPVNNKRLIMGTAEISLTAFNTRDNIVAIKDRLEKGVRFYTNISALGT